MSQIQSLKELRTLDKENIMFVRETLIAFCGNICMYDMCEYPQEELTLHHDPPFRESKSTSFACSYVISKSNHEYLTSLEQRESSLYETAMRRVRLNKELLLEMNTDCGCLNKNNLE